MSDTQKIKELEQHLVNALARIGQLESKVETMRQNINGNFNGHSDILKILYDHTNCSAAVRFAYVDVAAR
jgi:predicted RND superfamily exporter protein